MSAPRATGRGRSRSRGSAPAPAPRAPAPQIRSATTGFRLCGIDDEPFCPLPNGSCTSATSVRARWRISSANVSSDDATTASAHRSSACRSRWMIWVDVGAGSSPSRSHAIRSSSGSVAAYVPTAPESLPTRIPSSARATRSRLRASSNAQPTSLRPNVVGSACTPCVRPICSVSRCSSARAPTTAERTFESCDDQRARFADLERECGVDGTSEEVEGRSGTSDLPRRQAARLTRRRRTRRCRGGASPRSPRHARRSAASPRRCARPQPSPRHELPSSAQAAVAAGLDLEPRRKLPLVRPNAGHGWTGVAGDHGSSLEGRPAGARPLRRGRASSKHDATPARLLPRESGEPGLDATVWY